MIKLNMGDRIFAALDDALRVSLASQPSGADSPADGVEDVSLDEYDRGHVAGLMRVNHSGEVCAQALYEGQALTARDPQTQAHLLEAAAEERRHLNWCHQRLVELDSGPSRLNPLWYGGSLAVGALAGLMGDDWSLGFVMETERQVEAHLENHLSQLPAEDVRSRRILQQMMADEARHGSEAEQAGGRHLPAPVQRLMGATAQIMKSLAYRF